MKYAILVIVFFVNNNCFGQNIYESTKDNLSAVEGLWSSNGIQKYEVFLSNDGFKCRNVMDEGSWAYFKVTIFPEFICYKVSGELFKPNFLGSKITINGDRLEFFNNIDKKYYIMNKIGPLVITAETRPNIAIDIADSVLNSSSLEVSDSNNVKDVWRSRKGLIRSSSALAGMNFTSFNKDGMNYNGIGVSASVQLNQFKLHIPEFTEGKSKWNSFVLGFGASLGVTSNTIKIEGKQSTSSTLTTAAFNANLGYTLGLGRFLNKSNWKGAVIDFTYKPSYMMLHPSEGKATNQFNFVGFGVDINFSDFNSSLEKIAPKAGKKISFMILPQTDKTPLFISITFGLVWYD